MSPFNIKDCTLAAIATGVKAQSLLELHDKIIIVPQSCIFLHFWGGRLTTTFQFREFHNDFSTWAHHSLHDDILAERLELIDPSEFKDMEELRFKLLDIIENRLDEKEIFPWVKTEEPFQFIRSKIIIFDTRQEMTKPEDLPKVIPLLTLSSLFYHFIDSARRTPEQHDDFSIWLTGFGSKYQNLIDEFQKVDPYFISLSVLQKKLIRIVTDFFQRSDREHNHE
jgi:hypothetical protein